MFASLSPWQGHKYDFFICFLQSIGHKPVSTFKLGSIILLEQNSCNDLFWNFLPSSAHSIDLYVSSLFVLKVYFSQKRRVNVRPFWIVVMWAADCRYQFHKNITPLAFLSTTPSLTESVVVLTGKWNFPGKWNLLSKWYCDKMHAMYSSKHCTLRSHKHQLYEDIKSRY